MFCELQESYYNESSTGTYWYWHTRYYRSYHRDDHRNRNQHDFVGCRGVEHVDDHHPASPRRWFRPWCHRLGSDPQWQ